MATHSSILAWRIPWIEEPGRLQSMGSQRVGHNWVISLSFFHFQIVNERRMGQLQPVVTVFQDACLPLKNSWPGVHTLYTLKQAGTDGGRNTTEVCAIYEAWSWKALQRPPWLPGSLALREARHGFWGGSSCQVASRLRRGPESPVNSQLWLASQCEWATWKADPAGPVKLSSDRNFRRHRPRTS